MRGPLDMSGQFSGHTNANGPAGYAGGQSDPTRGGGGVGSNYQGAIADYAHNYLDDPLSRGIKMFTGFGLQQPNINKPATYANGLAHTSFNPAQVAGTVLGGAFGVPGVGTIAGGLYDMAGGPHPVIGSGKPGIPGGEIHDFSGGVPGGQSPGGQNTGGNPMLAFGGGSTPGGATFGQQPNIGVARPPQPPVMTPPGQPGQPGQPPFFTPQLPNHTVPQGYQSAFPLSDRDKALLYSKALTGAA